MKNCLSSVICCCLFLLLSSCENKELQVDVDSSSFNSDDLNGGKVRNLLIPLEIEDEIMSLEYQINKMEDDMKSLVHYNCNEDLECATVPMGMRVCGGADSYMLYSKVDMELGQIEEMSVEHQAMSRNMLRLTDKLKKLNGEGGLVGTCDTATKAREISCIEKKCQVVAPLSVDLFKFKENE